MHGRLSTQPVTLKFTARANARSFQYRAEQRESRVKCERSTQISSRRSERKSESKWKHCLCVLVQHRRKRVAAFARTSLESNFYVAVKRAEQFVRNALAGRTHTHDSCARIVSALVRPWRASVKRNRKSNCILNRVATSSRKESYRSRVALTSHSTMLYYSASRLQCCACVLPMLSLRNTH